MSRQPIGKGERVTFILNPAFPKERLILDYFSKSFNKGGDIKEILYDFVIKKQLSNKFNSISNDCSINDNSIIKQYSMNDNSMVNDLSKNDNKIINELLMNNNTIENNDFNINLDSIEDKEIRMEHDLEEEVKRANSNALDFLNSNFKG